MGGRLRARFLAGLAVPVAAGALLWGGAWLPGLAAAAGGRVQPAADTSQASGSIAFVIGPLVTATPSETPTGTGTPAGTGTPTLTRTATPQGTGSPTTTPASTASPSPTRTATPPPGGKKTATSTPTRTATPAGTATPTPGTVPPSVHVGDLDGAARSSGTGWRATVTITILNQAGQAADGATVTGTWGGDASGAASCVTNHGLCSVTASGLRSSDHSVTFTVTGVADPPFAYNPDTNHDPDGTFPDGAAQPSITIGKP